MVFRGELLWFQVVSRRMKCSSWAWRYCVGGPAILEISTRSAFHGVPRFYPGTEWCFKLLNYHQKYPFFVILMMFFCGFIFLLVYAGGLGVHRSMCFSTHCKVHFNTRPYTDVGQNATTPSNGYSPSPTVTSSPFPFFGRTLVHLRDAY